MERGAAVFAARIDGRAGREEGADGIGAVIHSEVGEEAFPALPVDVARRRCRVRRGEVAIEFRGGRIGAVRRKQFGDIVLAVAQGHRVRAFEMQSRLVRVGAGIQKRCNHGGAPSAPDCPRYLVRIGTGGEEQAYTLGVLAIEHVLQIICLRRRAMAK
jgi:hypothetical protein